MFAEALFCVVSASLAWAQTSHLQLDTVSSFNTSALPNPPVFLISSGTNISISIVFCSSTNPANQPRFFLANGTQALQGVGGLEIVMQAGYGVWSGALLDGGTLSVAPGASAAASFEVGTSNNGPIHAILADPPLFGDTTSNQALLFSSPFLVPPYIPPTYPNYTLPSPDPGVPSPPAISPNNSLVVLPTLSSPVSRSACLLSAQKSSGTVANQSLWLKDEDGWRTQFLVSGLTPLTNYTAYVIQNNNKVSGPILFATKSGSFSCPLVHSLPYCPAIAYAIPLPSPPDNALAYDSSNLPNTVSQPLISYLTNFTTSLTTFACGRDWYSPLVGCDDCQRAYRKWLCAITFTRCGEASPANVDNNDAIITASVAPPSATRLGPRGGASAGAVPSALVPNKSSGATRNPALQMSSSSDGEYKVLLPCLETCTAMDRACPSFLGLRCPTSNFNAAASYGVGYVDGVDGAQQKGVTGVTQDVWGNVWCNAG